MPINLTVPPLPGSGIPRPDLSDLSAPIIGQSLSFASAGPSAIDSMVVDIADVVTVAAQTGPRTGASLTMSGPFPAKLNPRIFAAENPIPAIEAWLRSAEPTLISEATIVQGGGNQGGLYVLDFIGAERVTAKVAAESLTLGDIFKQDNRILLADAPDALNGGRGADTIASGGGDDTIGGGGGRDDLAGGPGADVLSGGRGRDTLDGGSGNDILRGDAGNDLLRGAEGNDTLLGGNGRDRLDGGTGSDRLEGGKGNDDLDGGAGLDVLVARNGTDKLTGGDGPDSFILDFTPGDGSADRFVIRDFDFNDLIGIQNALAPGQSEADFMRDNISYNGSRMVIRVGEDRAFVNGLDTQADFEVALAVTLVV